MDWKIFVPYRLAAGCIQGKYGVGTLLKDSRCLCSQDYHAINRTLYFLVAVVCDLDDQCVPS